MRTGGDRGCLVLVRCKYNLERRERGRYMANYRRRTRLLNCIANACRGLVLNKGYVAPEALKTVASIGLLDI